MTSDLARNALDAAPDALVIIDDAGIIRFANRQTAALFGSPCEALLGRNVDQLLPERFRSRHAEHRHRYQSNQRVRPMGAGLDLFALRADGSEFPVEISLSPIQHEGRQLVAAAIRDVTERKNVETALILAHRSAETAREMAEQARADAERADQSKSRFLAMASHDLRQPLQALSLVSGVLRRIGRDPQITELVAQQDMAISAMSRLLSALLDISKLESGAIKPDPADFTVAALFEEMRREFASLAHSKGLGLDTQIEAHVVHSDRSLIEQILRNLVSNAIKYTREGRVHLRSRSLGHAVAIEVADTGIGIDAGQLPYIFDEFYQVGVPANATRDGYGLGLSIVQRLVRLLGIQLDVTSEVGHGSVFSLRLPAAALAPASVSPEPTGAPPAAERTWRDARPHVLLIEDDPAVRDATRLLLRVEGYDVFAVAGLDQARASLAQRDADIVISDYHLGDGATGSEVIAALRAQAGRPLRSVLITGDTSSVIRDLPRDPLLRVASKPVNADELLRLLRELLAAV